MCRCEICDVVCDFDVAPMVAIVAADDGDCGTGLRISAYSVGNKETRDVRYTSQKPAMLDLRPYLCTNGTETTNISGAKARLATTR